MSLDRYLALSLTPQSTAQIPLSGPASAASAAITNATSTTGPTGSGTPAPSEGCRITVPNMPGEEPLHLDENGTPRMVLNRAPATTQPKKPTDSAAQYASTWGRTLQLKNGHQEDLLRASQIKDENLQFLYLAGLLYSLKDSLDLLQPNDSAAVIPRQTEGKIDELSVLYILDPSASGYKNRPNDRLVSALKHHPEWAPPALLDHKPTMKQIKLRINGRFTHHRADIKDAIFKSLGVFDTILEDFTGPFIPIVRLTTTIIAEVGGRSCTIKVSLPLVARIAFLRNIYVSEAKEGKADGKVGAHFWEAVDTGLKKIRDTQNNDILKISQVFAHILEDDRKQYKDLEAAEEDLDGLSEVINAETD